LFGPLFGGMGGGRQVQTIAVFTKDFIYRVIWAFGAIGAFGLYEGVLGPVLELRAMTT